MQLRSVRQGNPRQATVKATDTENAWAAGFFDGEGCVSIRVDNKNHTSLTIIIAQKDLRPLQRFHTIVRTTAKIGITRRAGPLGIYRDYHRLTLCGTEAANALKAMLPYLIGKREVAEAGIALQAEVDVYRPRVLGQFCKLPSDSVARRLALAEQVKWFNTGRWAAAETKSSGSLSGQIEGCDSPSCRDSKSAEPGGNAQVTVQ